MRCIGWLQHGQTFWSSARSYSTRSRGRFSGRGRRPRFLPSGFWVSGNPVFGRSTQSVSSQPSSLSLNGALLGFVEDAIHVLFAARRKTMQPRERQFFLKLEDALRKERPSQPSAR